MFTLNNLTLNEEQEPIGLFDQFAINLKKLKQEVFNLDSRQHYELDSCPSYESYTNTFFNIIEFIDIITTRLQNVDENINEGFVVDLIEDIRYVQHLFESLVDINKKLQQEFKVILDNDINTIDGQTLVTEVSQARHTIFSLLTHAKNISRSTKGTAKIFHFPHTEFDTVNSDEGFKRTDLNDISAPVESPSVYHTSDTRTPLTTVQERRHSIHQLVFGKSGEILPNNIVAKKRDEISKLLGENASVFNWDKIAANDEPTVDYEIEDGRIIRNLIERAKKQRDGAMIQSIKNNLIRNAANDEAYDMGLETSILLADHIKNIGPSNPITLETIEYGRISIVSSETIEYGEMTCYKANIVLNNGDKVTWLLNANACTIGDLSNKKIGDYKNNNQLTITNEPCTVRRFRSRIVSQEASNEGFFKKTSNTIKSGFNNLMNRFNFGKK